MQEKFTLDVEKGRAGLWYITSKDLLVGQLFIAHESLACALKEIPRCIGSLQRAAVAVKKRKNKRS